MTWRSAVLTAAVTVLVGVPAAAMASPIGPVSTIHVSAGPKLSADTRVLDTKDIALLTKSLHDSMERRLKKSHQLSEAGGVLDIQLVEAKPTRPTFTQLGAKPDLSMNSVSRGGMDVAGTYTSADGKVTPVKFHWEAFDLSDARYGWTWTDAEQGFDYFAASLSQG